jgi:type I restriction enzyme S subunit
MNWADRDYAIGRGLAAIRHKSGVQYRHFLRGVIELNLPELLASATGSTFPCVSREQIAGIESDVPALDVQRSISRILATLDDKIELNRRMNQTLEGLTRALFQSWFVDFDPVTAKAAGRQPVGMSADTARLFPDAFEDSPLGPIPKGWRVGNVPDAIELNPTRRITDCVVAPYLDMANMPTDSHRAINWYDREVGSGMKFINGDVLLARITPCLEHGKTAFVDFLQDGQVGWGSTEYIVLRAKAPLRLEHAYFLARSEDFRVHAIANMTWSSGRQRVPASCFESYPMVIPTDQVVKQFGRIASETLRRIKASDEQSRTLAALRDALLPRLLSGELRPKEAEELVP